MWASFGGPDPAPAGISRSIPISLAGTATSRSRTTCFAVRDEIRDAYSPVSVGGPLEIVTNDMASDKTAAASCIHKLFAS